MVRHGFPERPATADPLMPSPGPRPWGTRFAVPAAVEAKHRKRRTHGVTRKETKYIDDGKEHTDSVDEPYEDEEDE